MTLLEVRAVTKSFFGCPHPAVDQATLEVGQGEIMALLGESGSGKTTLLRLIAGLEIPDQGQIRINSVVVFDAGTRVPPERRGVGMVFQEYALFPHLTVERNVAYGLGAFDEPDRKAVTDSTLELVGLGAFARRFPHELSGGQQQRVALARALAPRPAILLLDEPFSHLDEFLKVQVRDELQDILQRTGATALVVTHDTKDALSIADRIAVMREGRILQVDTPTQIYEQPASLHVARLFGRANLVSVDALHMPDERERGELLRAWGLPPPPSAHARLCIRPEHFELIASGAAASGSLSGKIKKISFLGAYNELVVTTPAEDGHEILIHFADELVLAVDDRIRVRPTKCCWIEGTTD